MRDAGTAAFEILINRLVESANQLSLAAYITS
jgi:hypothetical protein